MQKHADSLIPSSLLGMFAARLHVLDALMDLRQQHSLQFSTNKKIKPTPDVAEVGTQLCRATKPPHMHWKHVSTHPYSNGYLLTGLWNGPGIKAGVGREQPRRSNKAAVKRKGDKRQGAFQTRHRRTKDRKQNCDGTSVSRLTNK